MRKKQRRRQPIAFTSRLDFGSLEPRQMLAAQLLPDVFPWASESRGYLYDWVVEGNLLRFTTAFANQGAGHLELRGGATLPNGNQEVFQRIYNDDGTFSDRLAGEFTYHPGHGHIHFDGYAEYALKVRTAGGGVGNTVATGGKISFCIIDITKYNPNAGASRYSGCGQIQGVTAGWSDVYTRSLPDQYINISNVPDGDYWLEVTIDPDHQLLEADPNNNTALVPVTLNRGGSAGGDRFEPNNSFATAYNFGTISQRFETGLSIHSASDQDYYLVTAAADGEYHLESVFTNSLGNLDLFVYDQAQNLVASATTTRDNEHLHFDVLQGESYYLVVRGDSGATNAYDLELFGPGNIVTETLHGTGLPLDIPDASGGNPGNWVSSTLNGPQIQLTDLNVSFNRLDHTWLGDLEIRLTSPSGRVAKLLTSQWQSGGGLLGNQDNFLNTTMDDQRPVNLAQGSAPFTGSYNINHSNVGTNPLAIFNGENASGIWTVSIRDWAAADVGRLHDWSIMFTGVDLNPGDSLEPNNSFPQAVDLGMIGQSVQGGLSIHKATDHDFFRFQAGVTGTAEIRLNLDNPNGNLDFVIYDAELNKVAHSENLVGNEFLNFDVQQAETYYLEVYGVGPATNNYSLEVDLAPVIGVSGMLEDLTDEWRLVTLDHSFVNPIVIAGPPGQNDATPTTVRVRNVTSSSFEIRLDNWEYLGSLHGGEDLGYVVVEAGRHELWDGRVIEAGRVQNVAAAFQPVSFSDSFAGPLVILSQVSSANDPRALIPRTKLATLSGFETRLYAQELPGGTLQGESLDWLAIETGNNYSGTWQYEVGTKRFPNQNPVGLSFSNSFTQMPVILAALQTNVERDPLSLRTTSLTSSAAQLMMQEEQSRDLEVNHKGELVGWLAFYGEYLFGQQPTESFWGGGAESKNWPRPGQLSAAAWSYPGAGGEPGISGSRGLSSSRDESVAIDRSAPELFWSLPGGEVNADLDPSARVPSELGKGRPMNSAQSQRPDRPGDDPGPWTNADLDRIFAQL